MLLPPAARRLIEVMTEGWLVGIEIGGTKLQLGLGRRDAGLQVLERRSVEPSNGAAAILDQIKQTFQFLLEKCSLSPSDVRGVGVGFGGPVDTARGRTLNSFQVRGWTDFPLAGWINDHLGVSAVAIANDADAAGLAEARLGAGVGHSPLLYLTIGSGIGGALIVDGQICSIARRRGRGWCSLKRSRRDGESPARPACSLLNRKRRAGLTGSCSGAQAVTLTRSPPSESPWPPSQETPWQRPSSNGRGGRWPLPCGRPLRSWRLAELSWAEVSR
jgi:hypothetical protein